MPWNKVFFTIVNFYNQFCVCTLKLILSFIHFNIHRYSADYTDSMSHFQQITTSKSSGLASIVKNNNNNNPNSTISNSTTSTTTTASSTHGQQQNNNGYIPYAEYIRDYSPPPPQNLNTLRNLNNNYSGSSINNSNTNSNATLTISTSHMNGQIPSGNLSLTRNRNDLRQDNGLPNVQSSMNSLQSGLLGKCSKRLNHNHMHIVSNNFILSF